jgi:Rap1a immunity proteins
MRPVTFMIAATACSIALSAGAATHSDFTVGTTRDLVNLCGAPENDPLRVAALHFCEGYVVGAFQVYQKAIAPTTRLVCMSQPPTRDQGVAMFLNWAKTHPQNMDDAAVDGLFRFLSEAFPCR